MARLLIVEERDGLREALEASLPTRWLGAEVFAAASANEAAAVLDGPAIDAVVFSARAGDALELVAKTAALHRAAVAVAIDAEVEQTPIRSGVGAVPGAAVDDVTAFVAAVGTDPPADADRLGGLTLLRLVELAVQVGWRGTVSVRNGRSAGAICVDGGRVAAAWFEDYVAEKAVEQMMRLPGGTLTISRVVDTPPAALIDLAAEQLLEEAAKWAASGEEAEVEITEDDLIDFMSPTELGDGGFSLFSEDELADLALDDGMAIPIGPGRATGQHATVPLQPAAGDGDAEDT